ncbi:4Fe-4S dicluster domain-containing protein [Syntrophorhabdus aromaticivorans]|jgi:Fe-S oxidoreductase|uniref:(Fe-S)-binding protein n=1 Tax=Syntrophorhabdus aromaticivorans TaxID=328301 RepID=A0A971M2T6_9BACT|nr:(Fe-S)-binding protein [Syntrophorhabdus aromaticivorans]NLW34978.1 (Fe-S)-binding protein [Syntrophorhabdus aromaticivorans]
MNEEQYRTIFELTGYGREDFSVCLGCKICASVCTVNDLSLSVNPQDILLALFLGQEIAGDHALVRYCTSCYRCSNACPWGIRIPEVIRALKESLGLESPFERAFKGSVRIWGRVYEPYIFMKAGVFLLKEGYLKYMPKWTEYVSFHLPRRVRRLSSPGGLSDSKGRP